MGFLPRPNLPVRIRAGVVIVHSEQVALIKRVRGGRTYYLFPGGGVEEGETKEEAARREALEELGVHVALDRLVATVQLPYSEQYYYTAVITGGIFGSGTGVELKSSADRPAGSYTPVWLSFAKLALVDVRPRPLADAIAAGELAALAEPMHLVEE